MELIVEGRGTFIGKHQGRLRVTREQKVITEVPVLHLEQVIVMDSGVAISSDVIRVCYEGKRQALHFILQSQTRHLALFLRGERATYEPFVAGW